MSIIRQPLLHFLLIGAALFAVYALVANEPEKLATTDQVVVSDQDAMWLVGQFKATWRRDPKPDELKALIDDFVREEIYVREALALGLDQGDAIVRRRLRQKMEFLTEASAAAAAPDEEVLRQYYQENADQFEDPAAVSFSQILVGDASVDAILDDLADGAAPETLGEQSMLPARFSLSQMQTVDGAFGNGFFDQILALEPGVWSGPVTSGFGSHVVFVETRRDSALPEFETVRDEVELAWRSSMTRELREERYNALAARYSVERPDPEAVLGR
jgi:hypothetical protein